jgi:hypothetical protein
MAAERPAAEIAAGRRLYGTNDGAGRRLTAREHSR